MRDLGKSIVAKGFKKVPKVQKIATSGHTGSKIQQLVAEKYVAIINLLPTYLGISLNAACSL